MPGRSSREAQTSVPAFSPSSPLKVVSGTGELAVEGDEGKTVWEDIRAAIEAIDSNGKWAGGRYRIWWNKYKTRTKEVRDKGCGYDVIGEFVKSEQQMIDQASAHVIANVRTEFLTAQVLDPRAPRGWKLLLNVQQGVNPNMC